MAPIRKICVLELTEMPKPQLFGTLLVSKGGIEWRPYKKQKRLLSWEKFDQIIRDDWGD